MLKKSQDWSLHVGVMHTELQVDDIGIDLIENSPAYTYGDVPVYVADDRVIYTVEMPFTENTPLKAEERAAGWVSASDYILDLDSELVVLVAGRSAISPW